MKERIPGLIDHLHDVYEKNYDVVRCLDVRDIFIEFGLSCEMDRDGNIECIYYEHSKFNSGWVEEFFEAIAQYVEPGSFITFCGEDDCLWAYYFDGLSVREYTGCITYGDMPVSGPKYPDKRREQHE